MCIRDSFGGGQVDITSGKFVFQCTEAYRVRNGKVGEPLKGVTLIGDGPTVLTQIRHVGNDMELDPGIGVCGKAGQGVPCGGWSAQPLCRKHHGRRKCGLNALNICGDGKLGR